MRGILLLAPFFLIVAACSTSATTSEGDVGAEDFDATTAKVTASCKLSRAQILASASSTRQNAITRGFQWWDAKVPYSQSRQHNGYRTDCSGFVSMAWQLKAPGFTTADFSSGGAGDKSLGSYDTLAPGDALVRRVGGSGHVMMFLGWNDAAHTQACTIEEADTALDMQFGVHAVSSLKSQSFKAIRNSAFGTNTPAAAPAKTPAPTSAPAATTSDDDDSTVATGDDDDSSVTPSSNSSSSSSSSSSSAPSTSACNTYDTIEPGCACGSDGQCNPGNDGSGLICVAGQCTGGCHTDAQCPGSTSCVDGDCE